MNRFIIPAAIAVCLVSSSCTVITQPVELYAVKGPEMTTVPHLSGVILTQAVDRGSFTIAWPSGETGTGHYPGLTDFPTSATRARAGSVSGNTASTPLPGGTHFTSRLSPQPTPIVGTMVTNRGRRVEFRGGFESGTFNGFGIAWDNRGNVWGIR